MNSSKKSKEIVIRSNLLSWYKKNKRKLPWRKTNKYNVPNAYYVFVSEYMLQQTTVSTVKNRFKDFILKWPSLDDLAKISESKILNFWAGKMYPKQVFQHKNDSTLFSPGWRTLALGKTGMISQNPWIQGGGNSDFVFESDFEFIKISKKYKRTSKVVMTGDQSSDLLFKSLIKKKIKKNKKKTILFAVPNDAEHNLCSWKEHIIRIRKYAEIFYIGS